MRFAQRWTRPAQVSHRLPLFKRSRKQTLKARTLSVETHMINTDVSKWLMMVSLWVLPACAIKNVSSFYVRNADFVVSPAETFQSHQDTDFGRQYLEGRFSYFGISAHRLRAGQKTVIAYRMFQWRPLLIDYAGYTKFTVAIDDFDAVASRLPIGESIRIPLENAHAIWSKGPSSFPERSCLGRPLDGYIEIKRTRCASFRVKIWTTILPLTNRCSSDPFIFAGALRPKELDELTAWEGRESDSIFQESVP